MATTKLENRIVELETKFSQRITELEEQISQLSRQVNDQRPSSDTAWWKRIVGIYRDDPEFEEAMRLGREYREALRPNDNENAD